MKEKEVMKEVSMLQSLNNPHILRLFAFWEDTTLGAIVLATELMTGGTLDDYGKCSSLVIRNWGRQILLGLHALHSHEPPIIHRDLKCTNIFVNKATGIVKIGDLGVATLKTATDQTKSDHGTPSFQAPEIAQGHYNELVDVYSFGMCLLQLSTGKYPFEECSYRMQILYMVAIEKKNPRLLESVSDDVIKDIITHCINCDFKERYSVTQLLSVFFKNVFEVTVQQESRPTNNSKITLKIQDTRKDDVAPALVTYKFSCHSLESITRKLVDSGKVAEANRTKVMASLIEKVEVLTLLSQSNIGVDLTDSSVEIDTRYLNNGINNDGLSEKLLPHTSSPDIPDEIVVESLLLPRPQTARPKEKKDQVSSAASSGKSTIPSEYRPNKLKLGLETRPAAVKVTTSNDTANLLETVGHQIYISDDMEWYHGHLSTKTAESRMKSAQENGSYLVYHTMHGRCVLLVHLNGDIVRLAITRDHHGLYVLEGGSKSCRSVEELIKAHRGISWNAIKYNNQWFRLSKNYVTRLVERKETKYHNHSHYPLHDPLIPVVKKEFYYEKQFPLMKLEAQVETIQDVDTIQVDISSISDKEWYHGEISSEEAESRMKLAQENGSYLVYHAEDGQYSGKYVVLVHINGEIVKLAITRDRHGLYVLEGGSSSHRSVKDLIKAHKGTTGNTMKYKGLWFCLSKKYVTRAGAAGVPTDKKWYHRNVTPDEAEKRLLEGGEGINGSYLVYDHPREEGNFVLLVYYSNKEGQQSQPIYRWKISKTRSGKYILGEISEGANANPKEYNYVKELIKAHRGATGKPIRLKNGELVVLNKSYVMCV